MADWTQRGSVIVASDAGASDLFGFGVALSRDGLVLAVGAIGWDGGAGASQGAVYIYDWNGSAWVERGTILTASDAAASDTFGRSLALSSDGAIMAVGATGWESVGTNRGGVYIYDWNGSAWVQRGSVLTAGDAADNDRFGASVAISSDGSVLTVGADSWEGATQTDAGGVYVFDWNGSAWVQRGAVLFAADARQTDRFGSAVALSSDAAVLAVGAPVRDSVFSNEGAVYTYDWNGSAWVQRTPVLLSSDVASADDFGDGVALSSDGAVLSVGATGRTDVFAGQGAVYTYDWNGVAWVERTQILTASDASASASFGRVALSGDAAVLVVGSWQWDGTLTDQGGVYVYDVTLPPPEPASLPLILTSTLTTAAASLPLRLLTLTPQAAGTVPLRLEAPDAAHFGAAAARWTLAASLDGAAVPAAQIVNQARIAAEEDASTLCTLVLQPASGAVDPRAYEGRRLVVQFVGLDSSGAESYRATRFTGTVATATYDPDSGLLSLEASTDLQGLLENADRAVIDQMIPGDWSEHVFDPDADGYRYAQDRASTRPAEMHVDAFGRFAVVDWAAKVTADLVFTDSARFGDTLRLDRVPRRDLITEYRIDLDYRFTRLRHREMTVQWLQEYSFCHYLNNGWNLCAKDMVQQAADGTAWTRISTITYVDLPPTGTYCAPPIAWAGGADDFCLGATWRAARRWAQTVTEEYSLTVSAPDLRDAVGTLIATDSYGVAQAFDAAGWEASIDYSSAPAASVFNSQTSDYELEAAAAEATGRAAMQAAQVAAIARARTAILNRARRTRVTLSPVYRPDLSLAQTVRIETPYLTCQGKVAAYEERFALDTGALDLTVEIALSRHDGSGLASDTPVTAAAAPALPAETASSRHVVLGYHMGGTAESIADNPDWDGYVTNVNELVQAPGAHVYRRRFVVAMPEIEPAARDALSVPKTAGYTVAVPEDLLTLSA